MIKKVFLIAEAGVNHNGDVALAKKLIDAAKEAGVDAVKFQTWKPGEITGKFTYKVGYMKNTTQEAESRYELSNRLALPFDAFRELKAYADKKDILFLSTPDGFESLDFLVDELKMPLIKVGSTEVTHLQYLTAIAKKNKPIILSTGLSSLDEVQKAVEVIRKESSQELVVLHCTSEYPAPHSELNVKALVTMREKLNVPTGLSDHSIGLEASLAAVALGAVVIEKHFTVDKSLPGPDHQASMSPEDLKQWVKSVRTTESLLGDGVKKPTASEKKNLEGIRRSVVAKVQLKKGTVLTAAMLVCKRPASGIQPEHLESLVGKKVNKDLEEDEPIKWDYLN